MDYFKKWFKFEQESMIKVKIIPVRFEPDDATWSYLAFKLSAIIEMASVSQSHGKIAYVPVTDKETNDFYLSQIRVAGTQRLLDVKKLREKNLADYSESNEGEANFAGGMFAHRTLPCTLLPKIMDATRMAIQSLYPLFSPFVDAIHLIDEIDDNDTQIWNFVRNIVHKIHDSVVKGKDISERRYNKKTIFAKNMYENNIMNLLIADILFSCPMIKKKFEEMPDMEKMDPDSFSLVNLLKYTEFCRQTLFDSAPGMMINKKLDQPTDTDDEIYDGDPDNDFKTPVDREGISLLEAEFELAYTDSRDKQDYGIAFDKWYSVSEKKTHILLENKLATCLGFLASDSDNRNIFRENTIPDASDEIPNPQPADDDKMISVVVDTIKKNIMKGQAKSWFDSYNLFKMNSGVRQTKDCFDELQVIVDAMNHQIESRKGVKAQEKNGYNDKLAAEEKKALVEAKLINREGRAHNNSWELMNFYDGFLASNGNFKICKDIISKLGSERYPDDVRTSLYFEMMSFQLMTINNYLKTKRGDTIRPKYCLMRLSETEESKLLPNLTMYVVSNNVKKYEEFTDTIEYYEKIWREHVNSSDPYLRKIATFAFINNALLCYQQLIPNPFQPSEDSQDDQRQNEFIQNKQSQNEWTEIKYNSRNPGFFDGKLNRFWASDGPKFGLQKEEFYFNMFTSLKKATEMVIETELQPNFGNKVMKFIRFHFFKGDGYTDLRKISPLAIVSGITFQFLYDNYSRFVTALRELDLGKVTVDDIKNGILSSIASIPRGLIVRVVAYFFLHHERTWVNDHVYYWLAKAASQKGIIAAAANFMFPHIRKTLATVYYVAYKSIFFPDSALNLLRETWLTFVFSVTIDGVFRVLQWLYRYLNIGGYFKGIYDKTIGYLGFDAMIKKIMAWVEKQLSMIIPVFNGISTLILGERPVGWSRWSYVVLFSLTSSIVYGVAFYKGISFEIPDVSPMFDEIYMRIINQTGLSGILGFPEYSRIVGKILFTLAGNAMSPYLLFIIRMFYDGVMKIFGWASVPASKILATNDFFNTKALEMVKKAKETKLVDVIDTNNVITSAFIDTDVLSLSMHTSKAEGIACTSLSTQHPDDICKLIKLCRHITKFEYPSKIESIDVEEARKSIAEYLKQCNKTLYSDITDYSTSEDHDQLISIFGTDVGEALRTRGVGTYAAGSAYEVAKETMSSGWEYVSSFFISNADALTNNTSDIVN